MRERLVALLAKRAHFEWRPKEKAWIRPSIVGTSLGAAGAMVVLGKLFGISAVAHSSGAMILTGSAGYITGTFVAGALIWVVWPILVGIGIIALFWKQLTTLVRFAFQQFLKGFDWSIERLYIWRKPK